MNELDQRIQTLLEEATNSTPHDTPTLADELIDLFNGRNRQLMRLAAIKMVVAGLLFYFCCYQFFQQDDLRPMLAYATGAVIFVVIASATILYLWMQLNHNTTRRELKRLEMRLTAGRGTQDS